MTGAVIVPKVQTITRCCLSVSVDSIVVFVEG